jgi:transcriptional regulator with XRE-family HTH domain
MLCLTCQLMANHSTIEQFVIDKVKEKRLKLNISQAELARLMDVSEGFIGNIENPQYRAKYNLNHINELAKIFKCSPKYFLPKEPLK